MDFLLTISVAAIMMGVDFDFRLKRFLKKLENSGDHMVYPAGLTDGLP